MSNEGRSTEEKFLGEEKDAAPKKPIAQGHAESPSGPDAHSSDPVADQPKNPSKGQHQPGPNQSDPNQSADHKISENRNQNRPEKPKITQTSDRPVNPDREAKDALNALELEAKEFGKDAEIERILQAFKLDAYAILDLQPGVTESDIKNTYRKKSLLIHPDKTKNPLAPEAFDRLRKAQSELMDPAQRELLDEAIADARRLLIRENKWTVHSPELTTPEFARAWRQRTQKVLVEAELRRRRQARVQMQEEGREKQKAEDEAEARKRKREHDQRWEATREQRIGSWRDFQTKQTGEKKKKKQKLKPIG